MATPHRGSDHAALLGGIAEAANWPLPVRFAGKVRDDLIRGLKKDGPGILEIADDFKKLGGGMRFFSFVEMRRTRPLSRRVSFSLFFLFFLLLFEVRV